MKDRPSRLVRKFILLTLPNWIENKWPIHLVMKTCHTTRKIVSIADTSTKKGDDSPTHAIPATSGVMHTKVLQI